MITEKLSDFKPFWKAIGLLIAKTNAHNPYTIPSASAELNLIELELINIIKLVEHGDSLLPDNIE